MPKPIKISQVQEDEYLLNCLDAVDWLSRCPDSSIDLVITDPPYESLEKHRSKGTKSRTPTF